MGGGKDTKVCKKESYEQKLKKLMQVEREEGETWKKVEKDNDKNHRTKNG